MIECQKCGTKLSDDLAVCPECGAPLLQQEASGPPHEPTESDVRIYNLRKPKVVSPSPADEDGDIKIAGPGGKSSTRKFSKEEIEAIKKKAPIDKRSVLPEQPPTSIRAIPKLPSFSPTAALLTALTTILIVAAVIMLALVPARSRYTGRDQLLTIIHNRSGGLSLYKNGKSVSGEAIKSGSIGFSTLNAPGSAIAVLTEGEKNYDLYYSSGKTIIPVAENVLEVQMSANSDSIIYIAVERDGSSGLYLFNGQQSTHIAADAMQGACISPNGKTIAYSRLSGMGEAVGVGYVWNNGKVQEFGQGIYPFAVSDNGEYLYYYKKLEHDYALYAMNTVRGKSLKLADSPDKVYFNSDLSQIIFPDFGNTVLVTDAADKLLIGEGSDPTVLLPYGCPAVTISGGRTMGYILGAASFRSTYVHCGGTVFYVSPKSEVHKVTSGCSQVFLSSDTKTIFYLKNNKLRSVDGTHSTLMPQTIAADATSFAVSANGRHIYYIDTDGELMYKTGSRNPILLEEEPGTDTVGSRFVFDGDSFLYYAGNELSIVKNGDRRTYVFDLDRIDALNANSHCVYVTGSKDSETIYFISGDSKNYELY